MTSVSQIIETVFAFSVGLTALRLYLQINKVWKRKQKICSRKPFADGRFN
jgi:hypothetical protein